MDKEKEKVKVKEKADELELFKNPTRDILGFLKDSAPLKPWQSDVIAMLYEEALYFFPQRQTKMLNEGCASIADHVIMSRQGYVGLGQESDDCGIIEYSQHKMGVLGGKYSTNPYKLGFNLLLDIEERWNKGKFGTEYEDCTDLKKKENWDQKLMLGKEKVFEVIRCHNDYTAINEFFTEDFCNKYEFFEWKRYPNGEYKIESRDYKKIKNKLLGKYLNSNLPDIRLTDCNFNGDGSLMLQHYDEGRVLHRSYLYEVLNSIAFIWKNKVHLASYNKDGEEEVFTSIDGQIEQNSREEFESKYDRYPLRGE
jgi:stage V sporulation protein R